MSNHWKSRWPVLAFTSVVAAQAAIAAPPLRSMLHPAASPVRASFGYCYSGGGTNCVVDGDTFWIGGEKVRIADIDAPETHPPRCAYEARLGNQATEKLHALLNSGAVTMTSIDRDRDVYGRLLRNVSVNGADVGEAMVSAGVAREWVGRRQPWC
jgi:endonuclease YncB( thermonuclease family)